MRKQYVRIIQYNNKTISNNKIYYRKIKYIATTLQAQLIILEDGGFKWNRANYVKITQFKII